MVALSTRPMKKSPLLLLAIFMGLAAGVEVSADTYRCTFGVQERVISIIPEDPIRNTPCEVLYQKDGGARTVWDAKERKGSCEEEVLAFVEQQQEWGWECQEIVPPYTPASTKPPVDNSAELAAYKQSAAFMQALSLMSTFKMYIMEYYMMEGSYPTSLKSIGLKPEDMKTSSHLSDLTISSNGGIYALGNEDMGTDKVILLQPKQTMGGHYMEWDCSTNLEIKTEGFKYCKFDSGLSFPR
jgi:hypothetical protein